MSGQDIALVDRHVLLPIHALAARRDIPDEDSVHDARVAIKRLRARLHLMRDIFDQHARVGESLDDLRELAHLLGVRRDHDVLEKVLGQLQESSTEPRLRELLDQARQLLSRAPLPSLDLAHTRTLAEGLERTLAQLEHVTLEKSEALDYLERRLEKLRRRGDKALASGQAEALHEWRKRVKRLYFQMEMVPIPESGLARFNSLEALGSALGHLQDLTLLENFYQQRLTQSTRARELAAFAGLETLLGERRAQLLEECRALRQKL